MMTTKVPRVQCPHCKEKYILRVEAPKRCPRCGKKLPTSTRQEPA